MTFLQFDWPLEEELGSHREKLSWILRSVLVEQRRILTRIRPPQPIEFPAEDARP
jgi:hypothetical protein